MIAEDTLGRARGRVPVSNGYIPQARSMIESYVVLNCDKGAGDLVVRGALRSVNQCERKCGRLPWISSTDGTAINIARSLSITCVQCSSAWGK